MAAVRNDNLQYIGYALSRTHAMPAYIKQQKSKHLATNYKEDPQQRASNAIAVRRTALQSGVTVLGHFAWHWKGKQPQLCTRLLGYAA